MKLLAVIMARGRSRRMGQAKGLIRLPGDQQPFLNRVEGIYRQLGWERLVVTLPDLAGPYRKVLPVENGPSWLLAEEGRNTARTVQLAWQWWRARGPEEGALCLHPVDMPLVTARTVEVLWQAHDAFPEKALRPTWGGRPGHPVLVPGCLLDQIFGRIPGPADGTFRKMLTRRETVTLPVEDRGVILDFDDPAQVAVWRQQEE